MRRSPTRRACSVAVLAAVLLGSCGRTDPHPSVQRHADAPLSAVVRQDMRSVAAFWRRKMPVLYGDDLDPVERIVAYRGSTPRTFPRCNGVLADASSYVDNAIYCRLEHVIAYDAEGFERMRADHGPLAIGVVVAHEYAHAVQAQAGERGATLGLELQADCFSGAWAATGTAARSKAPADLDAALRSLLDGADAGGSLVDDPEGHGSSFDRVAAFSDGFHAGGSACLTYDTDPPLLAPIASVGTPRWDGSIDSLTDALGTFWSTQGSRSVAAVTAVDDEHPDGCGSIGASTVPALCIVGGVVRYDDARLRGAAGRWSVGYPVAAAYGQVALAQPDTGSKIGASRIALATDCAVGAFVAAAASDPIGEVRTDRRDLDEVVQAMAGFDPADLRPNRDGDVSLLDRVEALRVGVRGGLDDCAITGAG